MLAVVAVGLTKPYIQTRQSPPEEDVVTDPINVKLSDVFQEGLLTVTSPSEPMARIRIVVLEFTV